MSLARHITSALLPILFIACSGSKPMAKKAAKLDEAGMYVEAADMYMNSLQRKSTNVDAKIGLKKTGQQVLDDKLGTFFKAVSMGTDNGASVEAFLSAKAYQERVRRLGVVLDIPDHYVLDFERVKGDHLMELYQEGQSLLETQDFQGAEIAFAKIAKLEPGYKDASSLQSLAYMEPLYRAAKDDLKAGRYRKAYDELDRIIQKDPNYKDAEAMRKEALARGQYSVAVLPFTSSDKRSDIASKVQAYTMTALTRTGDPFLRIVDRENMDRILEEQRLGMSGVVDEQTAVRVGNLMGAQAVLMGTLIDYSEVPGQLRRSTKDGYESYRVQKVNAETGEKYYETRYKPVKYSEFFQENKVYLSFSVRLVSLETGEVLMSKVVEREAEDHAYYASYDGNKDALFPAKNGLVDPNDRARRDLRSLLSASRDVKSVPTLTNELYNSTSEAMARAIQEDLQKRLP